MSKNGGANNFGQKAIQLLPQRGESISISGAQVAALQERQRLHGSGKLARGQASSGYLHDNSISMTDGWYGDLKSFTR